MPSFRLSIEDTFQMLDFAKEVLKRRNKGFNNWGKEAIKIAAGKLCGFTGKTGKNLFNERDKRMPLPLDRFESFCGEFETCANMPPEKKLEFEEWKGKILRFYKGDFGTPEITADQVYERMRKFYIRDVTYLQEKLITVHKEKQKAEGILWNYIIAPPIILEIVYYHRIDNYLARVSGFPHPQWIILTLALILLGVHVYKKNKTPTGNITTPYFGNNIYNRHRVTYSSTDIDKPR